MIGPHDNKKRLLGITVLYFVSLCFNGAPACAQAEEPAEPIDEITITGSRIPRRDFSAPSPIVTLDAEEIRLSGTTHVEDVLNSLPQVVPDNDKTTNFGGSTASVNLRGLGIGRTLVMLNGRRFAASQVGGSVDINNIPAALIDRVEVVTGGASAVYGSDAVVGVVNFLLDTEFEGIEINAQYDTTQENDGDILDISVSAGTRFADGRGHVSGFFDYSEREEIRATARNFTSTTIVDDADTGELFEAGSFSVPGGMIVFPDTILAGEAFAETVFDRDGTLRPADIPADLYNFNADNLLQTPLERYVFAGFLDFDFTQKVRGTFEVLYARNEISRELAPTPANRFVTVAIDSPFIPAQTQQVFRDSFDPDGDGVAQFFLLKRLQEVGNRRFDDTRTAWRLLAGLDGTISGTWQWEAYYSWTHTDVEPTFFNAVSASRYLQAVSTDPATGGCLDPSGGCVPANIFGAENMSPEAADFIRFKSLENLEKVEEQVASLTLSGDIATVSAGPISVALGAEWRRLEGKLGSDPAPLAEQVLGVIGQRPAFGATEVGEVYGEMLVPLAVDQPLADYLAIEAGARRSDYSTAGTVDTWKFGAEWLPIDGLRLRVMYQESIRAPSIFEIFQESATQVFNDFTASRDLCSASNDPVGNGLTDVCVAQGMDPEQVGVVEVPDPNFVTFVFGGNRDLIPEQAKSITAGFVIQPPGSRNFSVSVDYFDIEITDAIQNIGNGALDVCFAEKNPNSSLCAGYVRDASGRIVEARIYPTNVALHRSEGLDLQLLYSFDTSSLALFSGEASLDLSVNATHYISNGSQATLLAPFFDCAGYFGRVCSFSSFGTLPEWKSKTRLSFSSGPLIASIHWRWIDGLKNSVPLLRKAFNQPEPILAIPEIGSKSYIDLGISWDASNHVNLYGGIQNLFNTEPPLLAGESPGLNTDTSTYDVIGRRYFLGVNVRY